MPIGSTYKARTSGCGARGEGTVGPAGMNADWQDAITAGGVASADNAGGTITNPSQVSNSTSRWVDLSETPGTNVAFRLKYVGAVSQSPEIEVIGRKGESGSPMRLRTVGDEPANSAELTVNTTTDLTDGTNKFSEVTPDQIFDRMGCDQFLVAVKVAAAGGTTTKHVVEFKPI